ncbi:Do family serine endopeptidase [Polymorphobacter sp. PAMC 29334]|uniref:Do family serine endopeptidase n=1 Tax=Polymorphobacter sp. PAMC 29334 TaxID=2862331 RepID=UPI001C760B67|nr:Do family serine endopeptidase [Polymorphobacter sp. PAMC 29334]QYE34603.1 Do family serine endopeptidase [Polymorphobacter sp. PAMC 29334]
MRPMMRTAILLGGGAIGGLALALGIENGVGYAPVSADVLAPPPAVTVTRAAPADLGQVQLSFAPVAKRAAPAVVNVYSARVNRSRATMMDDPFFRQFFGGGAPQPRVEQSLGSGVLVQSDGLIVTNNHVVAGADEILVGLADRREYKAKVVFADAKSDLALLRIDTKGAKLPVIKLGDSDRAEVGDVVLAVGNPFGVGQTVTHGIVSAAARTGVGVSDYQFFIQTDAAINPGNSGGALLDLRGDLVGINTAIYSRSGGSQGIGFAIPANIVRVFLAAAGTGKLVTGWIGAEGETVTADSARLAGLDRPGGVLVTAITPGSPAASAGIKVGDVITTIDGKDVADPGMLRYRIATQGVGTKLDVTLLRAGKTERVALTLAKPPETPLRALSTVGGDNLLTGVTVGNLSPAFAQELGAGLPERGVVVTAIDPGAPAARFGYLQPGDVIEALNGVTVGTVAAIPQAARSAPASVRINRGGQRSECGVVQGQLACRS